MTPSVLTVLTSASAWVPSRLPRFNSTMVLLLIVPFRPDLHDWPMTRGCQELTDPSSHRPVDHADALDRGPREPAMDEELRLALFLHVGPVRARHRAPFDLAQLRQVVVVLRVAKVCMAVREGPRPTKCNDGRQARHQVDNLTLPALIVHMAAVDHVQHDR